MGRSDRTDYWGEDIDPDVTARARTLVLAHTGAPQVLQRTVERAIAGLWPIADVVTQVKRTIGDATSTSVPELSSVKAGGSHEESRRGGGGGRDGGHRLQRHDLR